MIWKHKDQEKEFKERGHYVMWSILTILDEYSKNILHIDEIVITDAIRPPRNTKSYHPDGKGIDIRTVGQPMGWKEKILGLLAVLKTCDSKIGFQFEDNIFENDVQIRSEHIHIQYKEGLPR